MSHLGSLLVLTRAMPSRGSKEVEHTAATISHQFSDSLELVTVEKGGHTKVTVSAEHKASFAERFMFRDREQAKRNALSSLLHFFFELAKIACGGNRLS